MLNLLAILIFPFIATAAIPKYQTILSKTADNHGNGFYKIVQYAQITRDGQPLKVKETWTVSGSKGIRLVAEGVGELKDKLRYTAIYDGNAKYFIDRMGKKKRQTLPKFWFEAFYHFRYYKRFHPRLVQANFVPRDFELNPDPPKKIEDINNEPEPFVKLARFDGRVSYIIGESSNSKQTKAALWIEQDSFLVKKVRFSEAVEVESRKYGKYARNLWFPKEREIRWSQQVASLTIGEVKTLGNHSKTRSLVSHRSLSGADKSLHNQPIEDPVFADFYSRFR